MDLIRTFETRLDLRPQELQPLADVLDRYAAVMSHAQRRIHALLQAGHAWTGGLHKTLYKELGITSVHLNMAHRQLLAKLASVRELAKDRVQTLHGKIRDKKADSAKREKALLKLRRAIERHGTDMQRWEEKYLRFKAACDAGHDAAWQLKIAIRMYYAAVEALRRLKAKRAAVRFALHQNKRRLGILAHALEQAEAQAANPNLCFGSRKLFNAQYHLKENGFASHGEWLAAWRHARNSSFKFDGNALREGGNDFARLSPQTDGTFDLELRLPEVLKHLASEQRRKGRVHAVRFKGLVFKHGDDAIRGALANGQPVTISFRKDEKSWKLCVSVEDRGIEAAADWSGGALGVDLNADHVALALVDRFGNPVRAWTLPLVTYGLSSGQARDLIRKCARQIALEAQRLGVPMASERLDFARKKKTLKAGDGPRYARMLSSFSYNAFDAALASACLRSGVAHRRVNPAYTSLIGRVKFARRYGLGVHAAAAVSIARRAMELSEGLPRSADGSVPVPLNDSRLVTLAAPARKRARHVWSEWSAVATELKKVHEAQRLSGRRKRPRPSPRHWRDCGGTKHLCHGLSGVRGRAAPAGSVATSKGWTSAGRTPVMKSVNLQ